MNPKIDLGCVEWCQYAEQCVGAAFGKDTIILRDKLIEKMKKVFGEDQKRIKHTLGVLKYAEQIQQEEGGDWLIVRAGAILHDIGIHEAEKKHGSSAAKYQEIEGPAIAEQILKKYDIPEEAIEHICKIVGNHHSGKEIDTQEFKIVWDADWLVNLPDEFSNVSEAKLKEIIDKIFKTGKGKQLAIELFVNKK